MIGPHLSEASLNDYVERRLTGAELASAEKHLAECVRCRGLADRLCALLEQLRALPSELDPAVDLLPAIRAEMERRQAASFRKRGVPSRWRPLHEKRWTRAAAAALIVAAGTLTALAIRSTTDNGAAGAGGRALDPVAAEGGAARPDQPDADSGVDAAPIDELRRLETEYGRATGELLAAFREDRERLGDGTLRVIEDNIRTVERALQRSRQALSTDPNSPVLRELVLAAHRQRLDVLRRAAVVVSGS